MRAWAWMLGVLVACSHSSPPPPAPAAGAPASASAQPTAPASGAASTPPPAALPPASTPPPPPASAEPPPPSDTETVLIGEIAAAKKFDPKPAVDDLRPELVACYRQARSSNPALHGKLKLRILLNEKGKVINVDAEKSDPAYSPALLACIRDMMKENAHFPAPGGSATVVAPLVFRR